MIGYRHSSERKEFFSANPSQACGLLLDGPAATPHSYSLLPKSKDNNQKTTGIARRADAPRVRPVFRGFAAETRGLRCLTLVSTASRV